MNGRISVRIITALSKRNRKKYDTKADMMCVIHTRHHENQQNKNSEEIEYLGAEKGFRFKLEKHKNQRMNPPYVPSHSLWSI